HLSIKARKSTWGPWKVKIARQRSTIGRPDHAKTLDIKDSRLGTRRGAGGNARAPLVAPANSATACSEARGGGLCVVLEVDRQPSDPACRPWRPPSSAAG